MSTNTVDLVAIRTRNSSSSNINSNNFAAAIPPTPSHDSGLNSDASSHTEEESSHIPLEKLKTCCGEIHEMHDDDYDKLDSEGDQKVIGKGTNLQPDLASTSPFTRSVAAAAARANSPQRKLTPHPCCEMEFGCGDLASSNDAATAMEKKHDGHHHHDHHHDHDHSHSHAVAKTKGKNSSLGNGGPSRTPNDDHGHEGPDHHGHSHSHDEEAIPISHAKSNKTRLMLMFTLTFGFFLVEIIVGYMSNSMALVADSFHMLSDVAALVVAFLAVKMSPKKWSKNTFGWARAEVLGALVNAVFLVALCFSILIESVKRFISPDEIHNPQLVLVVGVCGLVVNLLGICLFHSHGGSGHSHAGHHTIKHQSRLTRMVATDDNENDERVTSPDNAPPPPEPPAPKIHGHSHGGGNMNMHGVFLHLLADALGSVIVIASALIIWLTDWEFEKYVDPTLSVIMVVLILNSVWPLLQESAMILLQTVPTHIQIDELQRRLVDEVEGVIAVHEFHIWQLAGDRIIASAHIRCRNLHDYIRIAEKVKEFFHNEGIHSTTVQPEFLEHYPESKGSAQDCFLACPLDETAAITCAANSCCGPQQPPRPSAVIIAQ